MFSPIVLASILGPRHGGGRLMSAVADAAEQNGVGAAIQAQQRQTGQKSKRAQKQTVPIADLLIFQKEQNKQLFQQHQQFQQFLSSLVSVLSQSLIQLSKTAATMSSSLTNSYDRRRVNPANPSSGSALMRPTPAVTPPVTVQTETPSEGLAGISATTSAITRVMPIYTIPVPPPGAGAP